jgi:hypothetical protein
MARELTAIGLTTTLDYLRRDPRYALKKTYLGDRFSRRALQLRRKDYYAYVV